MRVRIKICGITRREDAEAAGAAGVDALGFMFFARSARRVGIEEARSIIRALPPLLTKVGVFVEASLEEIRSTVARCGLDAVQLHGNETPEFCQQLACPVIKAVRVRGPETLAQLPAYATAAWLLDAYVAGQWGGTGATFDWSVAARAVSLGRPVILAGGLTPANVAEAVRQVRPYAVDVAGGVEQAPGRKDPAAIAALVRAVRGAEPGALDPTAQER